LFTGLLAVEVAYTESSEKVDLTFGPLGVSSI